jgi:hypothetical protein
MAAVPNPIISMTRVYPFGKPIAFFFIIGGFCTGSALIIIVTDITIGLFCVAGVFFEEHAGILPY